jgi:dolichol kinase
MVPGLLPFVFTSIPHEDPLSSLDKGIVIAATLALTVFIYYSRPRIARAGESHWAARVLSYPATVLATLLLFPAQPEFAAVVVVVLAFGDGSASLAGLWIGGPRLPWNSGKRWAGTLAFVVFAAPLAAIAYWREAHPAVSWVHAGICGASAALVGTVAESWPAHLNDNLRVGVAAAVTVVLVDALQAP